MKRQKKKKKELQNNKIPFMFKKKKKKEDRYKMCVTVNAESRARETYNKWL